jgi:hypothetical protein
MKEATLPFINTFERGTNTILDVPITTLHSIPTHRTQKRLYYSTKNMQMGGKIHNAIHSNTQQISQLTNNRNQS